MDKKTQLTYIKDSKTFKTFYFLKEELVEFCRKNGLSTNGSKEDLNERISLYLDKGIKTTTNKKAKKAIKIATITENSVIESPFVCSELHRAFFKEKLGKGFSFNVAFQKYLKENSGKTYNDALIAYRLIQQERKNSKSKIDKQFEYNAYIRNFFEDNKGRSLSDAIKCWKFKKSLKGTNQYEKTDLEVLKKD